jgi:predicted NUDIX family phosphoesterase
MTEATTGVEQVLVVPRSTLMGDPGWHGIRTHGLGAFEAFVASAGRFAPRPEMEQSRAWKQVIPYLVLRDRGRYFLMQRTRAGGDIRLHDRWSIGVGGHLNPGDRDLLGGLSREWHEELVADFEPAFQLVGLLNDDTTDVGAVHLGAVYVAESDGRPVEVRETEKLRGAFASAAEVRAVAADLETWSLLAFDFLESAVSA